MKRHCAEMWIGKSKASLPPRLREIEYRARQIGRLDPISVVEENSNSGAKTGPQALGAFIAIRNSRSLFGFVGFRHALFDQRHGATGIGRPKDVSPGVILFGHETSG